MRSTKTMSRIDDANRHVFDFIMQHCDKGREGSSVKSSILRARYETICEREARKPLSTNDFGNAIAAAGIEKERRARGVFYLGLELKQPAMADRAAAVASGAQRQAAE
jgi:hypothetical protein